ncbi:linear amide C-N hydrolase [Francisellaceae bacterium]|nr:linear amide C-N hydrolase [Francisellaceae bacterium]
MKNKVKALFLSSLLLSGSTFACSDIFINKNNHHVEGRTLDFLVNVATDKYIGYVGQNNTTDIIIDSDKIPQNKITSWKNKYGFLGMQAFNGGNMVDGMNTKGLSFSALYLQGTKYPNYNASDNKPVIGVYDLGNYILSEASNVDDALKLLKSHQVVNSAISAGNGKYIKNLPLHYVIRDKTGHSAVIEFIDGKMKIYENAGNTLTNGPTYNWQLNNENSYSYLTSTPKKMNQSAEEQVHNYKTVYNHSLPLNAGLLGMPGDYTSPSRFVRGTTLLNSL